MTAIATTAQIIIFKALTIADPIDPSGPTINGTRSFTMATIAEMATSQIRSCSSQRRLKQTT
jgi:hypothetical protein